jgi:endoglucanase
MRRGINFGNRLDALPARPVPDAWFDLVRDAGFDTVRLPVRWSAHAAATAPYALDEPYAVAVDAAVDAALRRGLTTIVDVHHYDALQAAPDAHADRLVGLWERIAARYADRSPALWLEPLNEPHGALDAPQWNILLREALAAIRAVDPDRTVLIGPAPMNDIHALPTLDLPDDERVRATVHYYAPLRFTHQGAPWVDGADRWRDVGWGGDGRGGDADRAAVTADLERLAGHGAVFVGEFGTYERADLASRVRWTAHVRGELERLGLDWCYWDFATDFGVYDPAAEAWREPLRKALLP